MCNFCKLALIRKFPSESHRLVMDSMHGTFTLRVYASGDFDFFLVNENMP